MLLTFEQIKAVTVGAVGIREENGVIRFDKCTEKQVKAWYALSDVLGQRSKTTTGIHLDFMTDSKNLTVTYGSGGKYEIYVDGLLRRMDAIGNDDRTVSIALTDPLGCPMEGMHRVGIYLPSHGVGSIVSVELDDGASIERYEYKRKFLFIGDSITQGWNTQYDTMSYAYRVSRFFDAEACINGIGGAFYHETTYDRPDFEPDTVIIAYGTNDFTRSSTVEEILCHVRAYLELIKKGYPNARIFALSPIWREVQDKPMGSFAYVRECIGKQIEQMGVEHIDGLALTPPIPYFYADSHLHPNGEGFSVYAENLILELLKRGV